MNATLNSETYKWTLIKKVTHKTKKDYGFWLNEWMNELETFVLENLVASNRRGVWLKNIKTDGSFTVWGI